LAAPDIAQATAQNLDRFNNEVIGQVFETKLREASQKKDTARMQKLQQMVAILQQASAPPEMELIQQLVDAPSEAMMEEILADNEKMVTEELGGMFAALMQQVEQQATKNPEAAELLPKLEAAYSVVIKFQMKKKLR